MSTLVDLPPELILRISTFLTTPELGALRRSCKQIEVTLFDSFAREFFTKRQFMIEQNSLQALVDIANHPSLSRWLCEVIIGLDIYPLDPNYMLKGSHARYIDGYVSHGTLLSTGLARDLLVEAFSKLSNLRTVGLRDYDGAGRLRDGEAARWSSWGWSLWPSSDETDPVHLAWQVHGRGPKRPHSFASPAEIFPLVISALGVAQARPKNLEVFLRKPHKLTPTSFEILNSIQASPTVSLLAALKQLMLTVASDSRNSDYDFVSTLNKLAPLERMLQHTTNLEVLRINFRMDQELAEAFVSWLGIEPSSCDQNDNLSPHAPLAPAGTVTAHLSRSSEVTGGKEGNDPTGYASPGLVSLGPASAFRLSPCLAESRSRPVAFNLTGLDLGMMNVSGPTLVKAIARFNLKTLNLWKVALRCNDNMEVFTSPDRWSCFLKALSGALSESNCLSNILIGYPFQGYYSGSTHPLNVTPVRVQFTSDAESPPSLSSGTRSLDAPRPTSTAALDGRPAKPADLVDKATYRATYGSSVKQWLLDLAEKTVLPTLPGPDEWSTSSDEDDDGDADDDDDDDDDDEDDSEELDDDDLDEV